jgi:hyaluronoglucosaminidase
LPAGRREPGFVLRGTKGWAWTWEQYLAEVPIIARYKMNFLMSCYTSVFTDPEKFINRWWEPLPRATLAGIDKVARACHKNGITYCFSFHPALFTDRPLRYDRDADFLAMWRNYASVQALGVRWFSLSYDDIDTKGADMAALGAAHAGLANRLFRRLREKDPGAELIFCPVYYWGAADAGEAKIYTEALGRALDKDIFVFWTGDAVVTPRITRAAAESFRSAVGHRIIIWDNYPVNDRSGALHLGPVTGRDPDLDEVAYGYMSNPLSPQNEINRIPLLTCADYAYNPRAYDPARSIGQAIVHLANRYGRRVVLKDLVELYPGNLISGSTRTSFNCVLEKTSELLKSPGGREAAERFLIRVADVAARLDKEFPGRYKETKWTIAGHIARMREMLARVP